MKRTIKKFCTLLLMMTMVLSFAATAYGDSSNVVYDGNARDFIFEPGSDYSPTDLFTEFKGAMPGDTLGQLITVKNDADRNVNVKIYMRALGAHEDSKEFLSQLKLSVASQSNDKLFEGNAAETDGLTDWVLLGEFKSGAEIELMATLQIPLTLDNKYQEAIGYIDWEFKAEEFPIDDMDAPETGDDRSVLHYVGIGAVALIGIILLLVKNRRETKK